MQPRGLVKLFSISLLLTFCNILNAQDMDNPDRGNNSNKGKLMLQGQVVSNGAGLKGYKVSLVASFIKPSNKTKVVGSARTNKHGEFEIKYQIPRGIKSDQEPVMFVIAEKGASMLVTVAGQGLVSGPVVVNERTTIATAYAFAQFINHRTIQGNKWGMLNAIGMTKNLVDTETGDMSVVLSSSPNGADTTTQSTFNSLSNLVSNCVSKPIDCQNLLILTSLPGKAPPDNVLQAIANLAKYPWLNVDKLFSLSTEADFYTPALTEAPDAWTLFLKFNGSFSSEQNADNVMNGPGNFAIDEQGYLWIANNYIPAAPRNQACAGQRLVAFTPWGTPVDDSPYFGGGLSGAGFGIALAPNGHVWVGNFGFAGTGCSIPPSTDPGTAYSNSVSEFHPNGEAVSPDETGYVIGGLDWPQGTVADPDGNIWVANCKSNSVTRIAKGEPGKPGKAENFVIPAADSEVVKPFSIAIDHEGNAWVTGSHNSSITVFDTYGELIESKQGLAAITRPMGVVADSQGNVWVSNSDWMDMACPQAANPDLGPGTDPSIALFLASPSRQLFPEAPFTGGGLSLPWGIAVDGNDTVWVANFGFPFDTRNPKETTPWVHPNRVSHFCGMDTSKCPPGMQTVGAAISPDGTGYTSNALDRNTGLAIDPSGNVWLVNNWRQIPLQANPGANSIAVMVGVAAPLNTPVIGVPKPFGKSKKKKR